MIDVNCKVCGALFWARRKSAKYCSVACKQKQWRNAENGETSTDRDLPVTIGARNERCTCKHCGKTMWWKGRGRFPKFCSNSCRVSCNRFMQDACVRYLWGNVKGMGFDAAKQAVKELGTEAVEKMANENGFVYSGDTRRFWRKSVELWNAVND